MSQRYKTVTSFFISITHTALPYKAKKRGRLAKHKTGKTAASHYAVVIKKLVKKRNAQ